MSTRGCLNCFFIGIASIVLAIAGSGLNRAVISVNNGMPTWGISGSGECYEIISSHSSIPITESTKMVWASNIYGVGRMMLSLGDLLLCLGVLIYFSCVIWLSIIVIRERNHLVEHWQVFSKLFQPKK
jgi:hypothetical protein